jgi:hypothetical protein
LRISACVVTQEAVITITNLNAESAAKARGAYRKSGNRFEELLEAPFPRAAREFAEKTVDQAREAYDRSSRTLQAAVQTLEKSFDAAGQGAVALRRKTFDIAQKNLDLGFDLAKGLAGARNLSEIVELQAAYWRKQFDAFTAPSEEVRNRLFEFGAAKPKTAELSPESSTTSPLRRHLLVLKRRRKRGTAPHCEIPPPRGKGATRRNLRRHQLLGPQFVRLMKHNSGPEKRVPWETSLRRFKDPQRAFLPRKEGSKNPKRDRLQVWSLSQEFVRLMKDNPGSEKRVLRKATLFSKAFQPRSNLACLMGTLFALRALKLGGWSMALGARSLQTRFS